MATKIVPSDAAPNESVRFELAGVDFSLGGRKKTYETDDTAVIANAEAHPWLTVVREASEIVRGNYTESLAPEDDPLSAVNDKSNDPDAANAAEAAKNTDLVAIEAGLDQDKNINVGPVAETISAAGDKDKE